MATDPPNFERGPDGRYIWTEADRRDLLDFLKSEIESGNLRYVSDERRRAKRAAAARRRRDRKA